MICTTRLITSMAVVFAFLTPIVTGADETRPVDGCKGSAFRSKSYDIDEKGEVAVALSFEAGKEVTVTTSADKDGDVHLGVKGRYFEARDTSPSPVCLVKFTPTPGDDKFTLTIKNNGPGANKVTLKVKVAE